MDSDSDYDDIGESSGGSIINSVNDNNIRKPSKTNKDGKQVRGGDRQWSLQELFEDSDAFFVSELYKKIKLEFVTVRKRQFKHDLVEGTTCLSERAHSSPKKPETATSEFYNQKRP